MGNKKKEINDRIMDLLESDTISNQMLAFILMRSKQGKTSGYIVYKYLMKGFDSWISVHQNIRLYTSPRNYIIRSTYLGLEYELIVRMSEKGTKEYSCSICAPEGMILNYRKWVSLKEILTVIREFLKLYISGQTN